MELLSRFAEGVAHIGSQSWVAPFFSVVGIWTLIAVMVRPALMMLPERHVLLHYHIRMVLVYGLPVMLGVAMATRLLMQPVSVPGPVSMVWTPLILTADTASSMQTAAATGESLFGMVTQPVFFAGLLFCLTVLAATGGWIRMAFQIHALVRIRRNPGAPVQEAQPDDAGSGISEMVRGLVRNLGVHREVVVYRNSDIPVPMTVGWRRPIIILPEKHFEVRELELILQHEMVHIRRGHFVLQIMEESVKSLFFIHPLVHRLTREVTACREMTCDAELLATAEVTRHEYASLLYHNLPDSFRPVPTVLSASMSNHPQITKRIKTMTHYPRTSNQWKRRRTVSMAIAAALFVPAIFMAACEFESLSGTTGASPESAALSDSDSATSASTGEAGSGIYTEVDRMPEPSGGMQAIYEHLEYPQEAREAGIEGRVIVRFVIDADGTPLGFKTVDGEEINPADDTAVDETVVTGYTPSPVTTKSSVGEQMLYEAAVNALRKTEWIPARHDGQEVAMELTMPIVFRLQQ